MSAPLWILGTLCAVIVVILAGIRLWRALRPYPRPGRERPVNAFEGTWMWPSAEVERFEQEAEVIAIAFHALYEELAPAFDYETRQASRQPWSMIPENNRDLMVATVRALLAAGAIRGPLRD